MHVSKKSTQLCVPIVGKLDAQEAGWETRAQNMPSTQSPQAPPREMNTADGEGHLRVPESLRLGARNIGDFFCTIKVAGVLTLLTGLKD